MTLRTLAVAGGAAMLLSALAWGTMDEARAGARENFIASDRNRDGALTRSEFRSFINREANANASYAVAIKEQNRYSDAFDMVDTNGDGRFSREEAQGAPGQTGDSIR